MSVTVTLFKGISPNYGKHYKFFTSYADYIASLGNYYKRYTLTDDRISDNQIIFSAAENVDAAEVSYCYINRNDGNSNQAYYFYHVTSGSVRSGTAFLQLELDVWATYLQRVNFGEIYVERCNRAIFGQGVADETEICTGVPTYEKLGDFTATADNLCIVYVVNYDIDYKIFGNNERVTTIFANKLSTLKNNYNVQTWEQMGQVIGNIYSYGVDQSGGQPEAQTNASVLKAYIIPLEMLGNITSSGRRLYSKGVNIIHPGEEAPSTGNTLLPDYEVLSGIKRKTFQIPAYTTGKLFFGTKLNNIRLPRFISACTVYYEFVVNESGIVVNCGYGDMMQDITSAFEMDITISDNGYVTADRISQTLNFMSASMNTVKSIAQEDVIGTFNNISGIVKSVLPVQGSYAHASGGAAATFRAGSWSFNSPYYTIRYTPIITAGYTLRNSGANFNSIYTQPLVTIFNSALLGVGPPNSTYIQGDIDCYGAQKDVIDFFVQRFREGVYLEKI